MYRFYCKNISFQTTQITLTDLDEIHHIKNVLRLKSGHQISLFNNERQEALGIICDVSHSKVSVEISTVKQHPLKNVSLILACAIPKRSKFEWIIEKATELGVDEIIPLQTHHTEVHIKENLIAKKLNRFQTVAMNAAKQSKRCDIPHIHIPLSLEDACANLKPRSTLLIPSLSGHPKPLFTILKSFTAPPQTLSIFIGPEGDFSKDEYRLAQQQGCIPVSLGSTILKVETAALSTLACTQLFFHQNTSDID